MPFDGQNNKKYGRSSTSVSHCMNKLVESQKRRILVFKNGESSRGVEVVANRIEEVCLFFLKRFIFLIKNNYSLYIIVFSEG